MVLHILCPIVLGAIIYCLMSPDVIFVKKINNFISITESIPVFPADSAFLRFIRNYLPDMAWGYSLVFVLFSIIGNDTADIGKVFWTAFLFSATMEIMQKTSFFPGTFDAFDIFTQFLAETIAVYIIYKLYSKEEF